MFSLRFPVAPRPLPEFTREASFEWLPKLSCRHNDLAAMMGFMGNKIGEKVHHIIREVQPRGPGRQRASLFDTRSKQSQHRVAALLHGDQHFLFCRTRIETSKFLRGFFFFDRVDPHLSCIMEVRHKHTDCFSRIPRDLFIPEFWINHLNQINGDLVSSLPAVE